MKDSKDQNNFKIFDDLRQKVALILKGSHADIKDVTETALDNLLHELEVYHIELKMQNDELLRAHVELEKSRHKYIDLYDFSSIGYFCCDEQNCISEPNLAFAGLFGIERGNITGKKFTSYISPDSQDEFYFHKQRIFQTLEKQTCQLKLLNQDGLPVYAYLQSLAIEDDNGKHTKFRSGIIDITDLKKSQVALIESESRQRKILDSLETGIVIIDPEEHRITYANPKAVMLIGISREEILGRKCHQFICPAMEGECPLTDLGQKIDNSERKLITADGKTIPIIKTVVPIMLEGRKHYLESFVDISELKKSEEATSNLATAVEQADEAIMIVGTDGTIKYLNHVSEQITGYSSDELLGKNLLFLERNIEDQNIYNELWKTVNEGATWKGNIREKKKDGTYCELEATVSPVRNKSGEIISFVSIARDSTKELELNKKLIQAQKMESIGTMAGGIAHDFNNILGIILGYAELSLLDFSEESATHRNINKIFQAATRAKELVKQILAFSRQTEIEKKPLKITPVVQETLELLRASLPSTIEIRRNFKADFDVVLSDITQIQQLIMNLCANAGHAMEKSGGVLEVNLSNLILNPQNLSSSSDLTPGSSCLELTISDTGAGIASENLERIFEPYFSTREKEEGTGLGLSVTHGIVKATKGEISVSSELGKGTTFRVLLPLALTDEEKTEAENPALLPIGDESILLVDDEQILVEMEKQMLERLGYKVDVRTSPVEGLETFRANPDKYDLVITDKTMPNMTGFQLAEELLRIRPGLPVIICTGLTDIEDATKAASTGIREIVMKPVSRKEIAEAVRRVLDSKA